ncbi:hypothetical protein QBC41DRAFT_52636 [Cercophora samala]|uniref:Uncharacterized protein n=1 Tax=Cercophora samala TaxID=330535 RepID=A0AA39ZN72_9PEZI|nr:hypothetical protein QBC41DRAFT_52636 [Cercophora samala]
MTTTITTAKICRSVISLQSFACAWADKATLLAQRRTIINPTYIGFALNRRYRMQATAWHYYTQHLFVTLPWMGKSSALDGYGPGLWTVEAGFLAGLSWRWSWGINH